MPQDYIVIIVDNSAEKLRSTEEAVFKVYGNDADIRPFLVSPSEQRNGEEYAQELVSHNPAMVILGSIQGVASMASGGQGIAGHVHEMLPEAVLILRTSSWYIEEIRKMFKVIAGSDYGAKSAIELEAVLRIIKGD